MGNYVTTSLETHLFFARIMKEHAMFLLAGFMEKDGEYRKKAEWFKEQFEDLLRNATALSEGMVNQEVLSYGEVVTEFTSEAEVQTQKLTGVEIDGKITEAQKKLRAGSPSNISRMLWQQVRRLNQSGLWLVGELIAFKEKIRAEVASCCLFTFNFPLLIEHIMREAKLYRQTLAELERNGCIVSQNLKATTVFWNQIMMEHAQFINGLLDPTECALIEQSDVYAKEFCQLLERAREAENCLTEELRQESREKTENLRDFKAAGTKGITGCKIRSVILPLLADHVLREANHYLRLLKVEPEAGNATENRTCGNRQSFSARR